LTDELTITWMRAQPGGPQPECLDQYGHILAVFGFNDQGDAWIPLVYAKHYGAGIEIRVRAQMEDDAELVWRNGVEYVRGTWLIGELGKPPMLQKMVANVELAWAMRG
jgi:hypothetical protein